MTTMMLVTFLLLDVAIVLLLVLLLHRLSSVATNLNRTSDALLQLTHVMFELDERDARRHEVWESQVKKGRVPGM